MLFCFLSEDEEEAERRRAAEEERRRQQEKTAAIQREKDREIEEKERIKELALFTTKYAFPSNPPLIHSSTCPLHVFYHAFF